MSDHSKNFDFYVGRIEAVPNYGLAAGDELLDFILFCITYDTDLSYNEYWELIERISWCYKKLLEVNFNEGWN